MNLTPLAPLKRPLVWFKAWLKTAYQSHPWFGYRISIGWFGGIQVHPK
ncbi:MAG: hypothetical protein ACFCVD_05205 [Nodosilinea sp.]